MSGEFRRDWLKFTTLDSPTLASKLFLWIGAPTALLLCFLIGPFEAADEPAHYFRMIAVANGQVFPTVSPTTATKPAAGAYEDSANVDLASRYHDGMVAPGGHHSLSELQRESTHHESGTPKFAPHSNTAIYPPQLYLVSAAATWVARDAGLPVLWWLYVGRLANALVAIVIIYAALRKAGDASLFLFAAVLLPTILFQTATVSADALFFPLAIAFAVLLLRIERGETRSTWETTALAVLVVILCPAKVAYLPLALLPPVAARVADRRWSPRAVGLLLAALLSAALWAGWAAAIEGKIFSIRPDVEIDPKAQLVGLIADPISSATFLLKSMALLTPKLIIGAVGSKLGWDVLSMPAWLIYPLPFLLAAAALPDSSPEHRSGVLAIVAIVVAIACYCAIFLLIYLNYNAVGADQIVGVQGRYFLPLAIIVLTLTPRFRISSEGMRQLWGAAAILALCSAIVTLVLVHQQYW